jgi:hypothetical protein
MYLINMMFSLIDELAGRDEFLHVLSFVDKDFLYAFCLTCKAVHNAFLELKEPIMTKITRLASSTILINWAVENGCPPCGRLWLEEAASNGHLDVLYWLCDTYDNALWDEINDISENAALNGHVHVLEWLYSKNKDLSQIYTYAALGGHINVLEWAQKKSIMIGEEGDIHDKSCVPNAAAEGGHRDVLEWLHNNGFKWDSFTCTGAATGGHLDILQWLRSEGCDWTSAVYSSAAKKGHLDIVKWAHANGLMPFDCDICGHATRGGHIELFLWARENGFH